MVQSIASAWGRRLLPAVLLSSALAAQRFSDLTIEHLPPEFARGQCCASLDVDGDLDVDLLFPIHAGLADLYRNLGDRRFSREVVQFPASSSEIMAVAAFDFDLDGDVDVMLAGSGMRPRLWRNSGGVFEDVTGTVMPNFTGHFDPNAILTGDLNGDGRTDVLLTGNNYLLLLQTSTGAFAVANDRLPAYTPANGQGVLIDVDDDGDLDFVGPKRFLGPSDRHRCWVNDGSGFFMDESTLRMPIGGPGGGYSMAAGDIDADGDVDLVAEQSSKILYFYRNDGSGSFLDHTTLSMEDWLQAPFFPNPDRMRLGDLDQDGDLDLVFVMAGGMGHGMLRNDGLGQFSSAGPVDLPAIRDNARDQQVVDIDGDGDLDIVQATPVVNAIGWKQVAHSIWCNDGRGRFLDLRQESVGGILDNVVCRLAVDFDRDGFPDLVRGRSFTSSLGEISVHRNQGNMAFLELGRIDTPGLGEPTALAAADVDGDDLPDLFVGTFLGQNRVLSGSGDGRFQQIGELPSTSGWAAIAAFADFDGDGDADLVVGRRTGPVDGGSGATGAALSLYSNNGLGVFTDVTATRLPSLSRLWHCVAVFDADADGDLDIFCGVSGPEVGSGGILLANDGSGAFVDASDRLPPSGPATVYSAAVGDVDASGRDDLVLWGNSGLSVLVAWPTSIFLNGAQQWSPGGQTIANVAIGDFDEDGRVDVYKSDSHVVGVYRNGGSSFSLVSPASETVYQFWPRLPLAGDMDMDGDIDVLFGGRGVANVQWNLYRQMHLPLLPAPGMSLPIEVHAARRVAGAPTLAVLVIGIGRERSETPWGVAWIDQAGPMGLHVMSVPWNTPATASLPIPPWLSLQGTELTFQALMLEGDGASPRLSNAITTTIR